MIHLEIRKKSETFIHRGNCSISSKMYSW